MNTRFEHVEFMNKRFMFVKRRFMFRETSHCL